MGSVAWRTVSALRFTYIGAMKPAIQLPSKQPTLPLHSNPNRKAPQMPHERDESVGEVATKVDPKIAQAKRDIDAGQVDTDMRVTPGLDSARRASLVPGPGGKVPTSATKGR